MKPTDYKLVDEIRQITKANTPPDDEQQIEAQYNKAIEKIKEAAQEGKDSTIYGFRVFKGWEKVLARLKEDGFTTSFLVCGELCERNFWITW